MTFIVRPGAMRAMLDAVFDHMSAPTVRANVVLQD
jgi:hypothetical protein